VARASAVDGRALVVWSALGAVQLLAITVVMVLLTPGPTIDLWPVALAFWCTIVLGSGTALVVAWRIGGWARPGQLGTALVALALLVSLLPRLTDLLASVDSLHDVRAWGTTVVILLAVGYLLRSLRRHDVDTAVRPVHELVALVGLMLLGVLASVTVLLLVGDRFDGAVRWAPAAACLVGAVAIAVSARRAPRPITGGVVAALTLMALGSVLRNASSGDLWQAAGTAAMCSSAWIFAGIARDRLRVALAMQDARSLQTLATLGRFSSEVSRERERRHDALNALAAIRTAADVLTSQSQNLDAATRAELSLAARDELARVERMLSPAPSAPVAVSLTAVLRPVLLARKHTGLDVDCRLDDDAVRVVPDIVARIVDNLLRNVERHARGATVRLTSERVGDTVEVHVVDTGPGIPLQRSVEVFEPGVTTGTGQGLGLPSARRLAQSEGGDLRLVPGDGGCHFVLVLPGCGARAEVSSLHAQAS
jgi:signal transduction histidine kinase